MITEMTNKRESSVMSVAEQLIRRGERRGERRGIEKGRAEAVQKLQSLGLDNATLERATRLIQET